jgi:hypothetical protein
MAEMVKEIQELSIGPEFSMHTACYPVISAVAGNTFPEGLAPTVLNYFLSRLSTVPVLTPKLPSNASTMLDDTI